MTSRASLPGGPIRPRVNAQQAREEEERNNRKPIWQQFSERFTNPNELFSDATRPSPEPVVPGQPPADRGLPPLPDPNAPLINPTVGLISLPALPRIPPSQEGLANLAVQTGSKLNMVERNFSYLDALRGEELSPTGQRVLDEAIAETEKQLAEVDREIVQVKGEMIIADALRNPFQLGSAGELQDAGVAPKGSATADLMARLVAEGGVTPEMASEAGVNAETMQRLVDRGEELVNAAVAGDNVEGDLDRLSAEAASAVASGNLANEAPSEFQFKMRARMRDLVDTRRKIIESDEDIQGALQAEDLAQASQKFTFNFDPTPRGAFLNEFDDRMAPVLEGAGLSQAEEVEFITELQNLQSTVPPGELDLSDPRTALIQQNLINLANRFSIDSNELLRRFESAHKAGSEAMEEMENVWESNRIVPGSLGAGTAIYQVAADLYQNMGEEGAMRANALANSPSLHMLIQLGSDGRVGAQRGGTMFGLGGLPQEVYERMGFDPETTLGDPRKELEALIRFVDTEFAGDPVAALEHVSSTKSWGMSSD